MKMIFLHLAASPDGTREYRFEPSTPARPGFHYAAIAVFVPNDGEVVPNSRHGRTLRWRPRGSSGVRQTCAAKVLARAAEGRDGFALSMGDS